MSYNNVDKSTGNLIPVAGATLYADTPVGSIMPFGGTTIPDGWLACSGQDISRTDYAELYAVIGTYYGNGNGSTTFNVPDLKEATLKGTGLSGKSSSHYSVGGITLGQFVDDQFQQWTATFDNINNVSTCTGIASYSRNDSEEPRDTNNSGGKITLDPSRTARTGTTTEVKAVGVNFIIKAKSVGAPTDIIDGVRDVLGSYSTTETVVGTWIDGKPIYRQAISVGTPQLGSNNWVELVTYSFAVDTFVSCTLVNKTSSSTTGTQLYNNFQIRQGSSKKVEFFFEQNITAATSRYVILEYTKV